MQHMAQNLPKFEGDILDIGNDYFLVKKDVVMMWAERIEKLEKELREMGHKKQSKNTGTVAGKEGRKKILTEEQKQQVIQLRNKGYSLREIAHVFEVSHETIRKVEFELTNFELPEKPTTRISTDPLERSNTFGTRGISEDFRKKD